MMKAVDLHSHSTASDGSYTPSELIDYAHEKGLRSIALTDHDTVGGLDEAITHANELYPDLEVIPGIEFSTLYNGHDVHLVGLYIDYKKPEFTAELQKFIDSRTNRNIKMCKLLTEHGMPVTFDEILEAFPGAVITRAHYGKFMLSKGYVSTIKEAFDKYIGDDCPCFIPREKVTPQMAIKLVLMAGGVPVLAHPILYNLPDDKLEELVADLKEAGLVGIEAIYSTYTEEDEQKIRALAGKYDLLISGGSDFHGANKPGLDLATGYGHLFIPEEVRDNLYLYHKTNK